MMISSKGRYALRVMLDMAEQQGDENIRLKDIAQRQDISRKYLESIMTELCKKELVQSSIGKVGGLQARAFSIGIHRGGDTQSRRGRPYPRCLPCKGRQKVYGKLYLLHISVLERACRADQRLC